MSQTLLPWETAAKFCETAISKNHYAKAKQRLTTAEDSRSQEQNLATVCRRVPEKSKTTAQISSRILTKKPEDKKLNMDIHHFRKPYILRESNYWFIILKGTVASLCIALNTIHLLNIVGLFPPTFSFFKLKAISYNHAITSATNNINKLLKDRVGLVVRWVPYSEVSKVETYSNCKILINNYQWSQWTEFEKQDGQRCGIKTYIRYYNLRIIKAVQSIIEKETLSTHCPANVQYKDTWERACCPQNDFQPLENYVNLSYDKAFCIIKSTLRNVNASELSTMCRNGKLWTPLPIENFVVNNSYYQRNNVVKSYDIQRGMTLKSYWIGVKRIDGRKWLINGRPINFDSLSNCGNHCYDMKILLSTEAYKKYTNKERYFVCVKNEFRNIKIRDTLDRESNFEISNGRI
ncbi:Uncharacterized protein BM_BM9352 [Brugia malayi]|uniref:Bm9352, isoform c n=1 Tax=Brugia malayi TaxID=6279 RepID=A0A4E9FT80_BRUMA|nr:Uncharacterized protein BM_BM9352 [Brugia malayi]VIP00183.1 Uncharacterized protein BM_BM9352 [Brugia malayi]